MAVVAKDKADSDANTLCLTIQVKVFFTT